MALVLEIAAGIILAPILFTVGLGVLAGVLNAVGHALLFLTKPRSIPAFLVQRCE